jgi:hypothetical protein
MTDAVFGDHETAAYVAKMHERVLSVPMSRSCVPVSAWSRPGQRREPQSKRAPNPHRAGWAHRLFENTPAQYHGRPELVDEHGAEIEQQLSSGQMVG